MAGIKYDENKPKNLHLIPWEYLERLITPGVERELAELLHSWARRQCKVDLCESTLTRDELLSALPVLSLGAEKYSSYNWEEGHHFTRISDAGIRHALWYPNFRPEDPETGLLHAQHLYCNVLFACQANMYRAGTELDNRPERP